MRKKTATGQKEKCKEKEKQTRSRQVKQGKIKCN
jgi:hypothetical protein